MSERTLEQIEDNLVELVQERLGDVELTPQRILVHVSEIHDQPTLRLRANGQHYDLVRADIADVDDLVRADIADVDDLEALADKIAADLMY